MKNISVFFPLYNEEGNISSDVEKATKILKKLKLQYEILLVNDGSKDSTGKIAEEIGKNDPNIRVIHHDKNLGYGEALKSGFYSAKYDTIVYTDGDGQFDFSEIQKFLEKIEDLDLVIGYRIKRQDPFFRILFKKGWKLSLLLFLGLTLKDVDCGFKMIRKKVLEKIPHLESQRGAMINAELAIKAKKYGFRVGEVGVHHYPRLSGQPTGASPKVVMKSYLDLLKLWWKLKDQKILFLLLVGILALAAFLRFYKLPEYMTFLGDEGRDAIVVKGILVDHHFPLIGPPTSVGNIYLGPLYYYMMASSMAIFWLNPVAATGMNALVGVITVYLVYYLGKIWFGRVPGLIASFLYAISPVTIIYSRSSWNPNPTPFFTILAMLGFYKAHKVSNFNWLILTGAFAAAALQMHYLAAILLPIFSVLWLVEVLKRKGKIKNLISGTFFGILAFVLVMSPLIWFDLRHNLLNYKAITQLLTSGGSVKANILENLIRIPGIYSNNLIGRYIAGGDLYLTLAVSALVFLALFKKSWPTVALIVWLGAGLVGLSFYQGEIYDHYLNFLNPVPFLLFGSVLSIWKKPRWLLTTFFIVLIPLLAFVNLQKNPLNYPPNNQLKRTQDVARFIISNSSDKPFNFALLAQKNYDAAYQFYLDEYGHKPKQVPFNITDQLFVVCEDPVCDPTHNAKYEIAGFGMSKINWQQDIYGVKIYRLVANPGGKP